MKKILKIFILVLALIVIIFFSYFNNTRLANPKVVMFYEQLKDSLKKRGYKPKLLVISTKRFKWHNKIQVKLSGAATKSRHLTGEAIDFLVFDINSDGHSNSKDVEIVYEILDKEIVKNGGGIGTYKTDRHFLNHQMVHIDCRGFSARWER